MPPTPSPLNLPSKYARELTRHEAWDVAIGLVHAVLALHGIECPDCCYRRP